MRILIIGGDGMLGHQLFMSLKNNHEVCVTLHQDLSQYQNYGIFNSDNSYANIGVTQTDAVQKVLIDYQPQAVINAAGIVKQSKTAKEIIPCLEINAIFPHQLSLMCNKVNARFIHISTDCVFSGKKGKYVENDFSDAEDLYGRSKYLGEVHDSHCVTLRSSIIGLELARKRGLIEWFLAQKGSIKGFKRAIYSGLTTQEMSRVIERILLNHPELSGVWHVSSDTAINKYELLKTFSEMLGRDDIQITPDEDFACDRSLLSDRFNHATGYKPPSWIDMLNELAMQVKKQEAELCC